MNSGLMKPTHWARLGRPTRLLALGFAGTVLAGCTALKPNEQRLVAKPNMTFSDSAAFSYNAPRLLPQLATGFAAAGGPQNSGCTSCR